MYVLYSARPIPTSPATGHDKHFYEIEFATEYLRKVQKLLAHQKCTKSSPAHIRSTNIVFHGRVQQ